MNEKHDFYPLVWYVSTSVVPYPDLLEVERQAGRQTETEGGRERHLGKQ